MTEEEKQELYKNICNDFNCGTFILAPQYVDKLLTEYLDASNVTQKAVSEKQKEQLSKAKDHIKKLLDCLKQDTNDPQTNYYVCQYMDKAEQFLKNNA